MKWAYGPVRNGKHRWILYAPGYNLRFALPKPHRLGSPQNVEFTFLATCCEDDQGWLDVRLRDEATGWGGPMVSVCGCCKQNVRGEAELRALLLTPVGAKLAAEWPEQVHPPRAYSPEQEKANLLAWLEAAVPDPLQIEVVASEIIDELDSFFTVRYARTVAEWK